MGLFDFLTGKRKQPPLISQSARTSNQQAYLDEDGRRHRADAPYLLPKDTKEISRLDYQHYIFRQILRGNTFAPVEDLLSQQSQVLDVGCGTGRWGYEMAEEYPQTTVIGIDLEETPSTRPLPPNYRFQRANLLDGLPFLDRTFGYVHQRLLVAGVPIEKWPWVIKELKRVTQPRGWVELVEMGVTFYNMGPATAQFLKWWSAVSATRGIDTAQVAKLDTFLTQAGFANIQKEVKTLPVGKWGGRLGAMLEQNILAGWPSMRPAVHTLLGVPPEQFDDVIARLSDEWNAYRTTYEVYFYCGQA